MNRLSEGKTKKRLFLCFKYLVLILMLIITVYPVLWMIFGAFKDDYEFYNNIWGMASEPRIENFIRSIKIFSKIGFVKFSSLVLRIAIKN